MGTTKKIYRLKGHESFVIREGWLYKGLHAVKQNPKVFSENMGADALGVGSNMAKSVKYWMKMARLIQDCGKEGVFLTDIGNIIYRYDPYFENPFSLWIVHINIVKQEALATSWHLFFNCFEATEFTKEQLQDGMEEELIFFIGSKEIVKRSLNDDCSALLHMYYSGKEKDYDPEDKTISPFAALGLVKKQENVYRKEQPDLEILREEIVLYLLECEFERLKSDSISIDDLLKKENMPGKILHLKRSSLLLYLEKLVKKEKIDMNITAGLDVVYKRSNTAIKIEEILEEYYKKIGV